MKRVITPILMSVLSVITTPTVANQSGDTPLLTKSELQNIDRINEFKECKAHSVEDLDSIFEYAYTHNFNIHQLREFLGSQIFCEELAVGAPIYKKKTGGDIIVFYEKVYNIPDEDEQVEALMNMLGKFTDAGGLNSVYILVARCQKENMCYQYGVRI